MDPWRPPPLPLCEKCINHLNEIRKMSKTLRRKAFCKKMWKSHQILKKKVHKFCGKKCVNCDKTKFWRKKCINYDKFWRKKYGNRNKTKFCGKKCVNCDKFCGTQKNFVQIFSAITATISMSDLNL